MPNPKPESHEPRCSIWITHIKFNFDLTSHSNDALNIRADGLHDIPVPEWDQSKFLPQQSPAAYAIKETAGQTVYIQCRFAMDLASAAATAHVKATGGGILGTIDSVTVNFVNGVSHDASHPGDQEYVQIPLLQRKYSAITRDDISWQWVYQCPHSRALHPMDISTHHRIYVVLEEPPSPWSQTDAQRYPWTTALDYAIVNANTSGLSDAREAAARVVQHVNGEPLQYDIWRTFLLRGRLWRRHFHDRCVAGGICQWSDCELLRLRLRGHYFFQCAGVPTDVPISSAFRLSEPCLSHRPRPLQQPLLWQRVGALQCPIGGGR